MVQWEKSLLTYPTSDDPGNRAFVGQSFNSGTLTEESCMNFCLSNGYNYAGVEYSQECCKSSSLIAAGLQEGQDIMDAGFWQLGFS
jgi:hypothetical protein